MPLWITHRDRHPRVEIDRRTEQQAQALMVEIENLSAGPKAVLARREHVLLASRLLAGQDAPLGTPVHDRWHGTFPALP